MRPPCYRDYAMACFARYASGKMYNDADVAAINRLLNELDPLSIEAIKAVYFAPDNLSLAANEARMREFASEHGVKLLTVRHRLRASVALFAEFRGLVVE